MKLFLSCLSYTMLTILFTLICFSASAADKVHCLCEDKTVQMPDCGICGSQLGSMEKTETGAACICYNKLKSKEVTCFEACKHNNGWTGEFVEH